MLSKWAVLDENNLQTVSVTIVVTQGRLWAAVFPPERSTLRSAVGQLWFAPSTSIDYPDRMQVMQLRTDALNTPLVRSDIRCWALNLHSSVNPLAGSISFSSNHMDSVISIWKLVADRDVYCVTGGFPGMMRTTRGFLQNLRHAASVRSVQQEYSSTCTE